MLEQSLAATRALGMRALLLVGSDPDNVPPTASDALASTPT